VAVGRRSWLEAEWGWQSRFVADAVGIGSGDVIAGVLRAGKAGAIRKLQDAAGADLGTGR